ncbi:MAG TPA: hypothetical protein VM325_18525 [Alphaproteobacteria bacterium]|nr:hypothetical protein [Alphaproteobacteria bacterium]
MWIIVLSTLLVAFVSGISIGAFVERGLWESALGRARSRIEAHRNAADRRRRFRVFDGGAPQDAHPLAERRRDTAIPGPAGAWRRAA